MTQVGKVGDRGTKGRREEGQTWWKREIGRQASWEQGGNVGKHKERE